MVRGQRTPRFRLAAGRATQVRAPAVSWTAPNETVDTDDAQRLNVGKLCAYLVRDGLQVLDKRNKGPASTSR